MTQLFSSSALNLFNNLEININKDSLIMIEDYNFNQFYIKIESNIILVTKYYNYGETITNVFEFAFYRHGKSLVPMSLKTKNVIASSEIINNKIRIFDKDSHQTLLSLFDKYYQKYSNLVVTELIEKSNNNLYVT